MYCRAPNRAWDEGQEIPGMDPAPKILISPSLRPQTPGPCSYPLTTREEERTERKRRTRDRLKSWTWPSFWLLPRLSPADPASFPFTSCWSVNIPFSIVWRVTSVPPRPAQVLRTRVPRHQDYNPVPLAQVVHIWVVLSLSRKSVHCAEGRLSHQAPGEDNSHASACLYLWDYWAVMLKHICPQREKPLHLSLFPCKGWVVPCSGLLHRHLHVWEKTSHAFCPGSCLLCRNGHFSAMFPSRIPTL